MKQQENVLNCEKFKEILKRDKKSEIYKKELKKCDKEIENSNRKCKKYRKRRKYL